LLVDHNIVRVPCVYRFFNDNSGLGYIIMEYMPGKVIEPLEDSTRIDIAPRNILGRRMALFVLSIGLLLAFIQGSSSSVPSGSSREKRVNSINSFLILWRVFPIGS
jgi:hypothetical protein